MSIENKRALSESAIPSEQKGALTAWGQPDFDKAYINQWHPETGDAQLSKEKTAKEVDFIERVLKLKPGDPRKILDAPSGYARHVIELTRRGYNAFGFDYSQEFLNRGTRDAAKVNINLKLVRGDIREVPFNESFDVALNLFTSFGFFEDPAENQKNLEQLNQTLKPGGQLLIDVADLSPKLKRYEKLAVKGEDGKLRIHEKQMMSGIERIATHTYDPETQIEHTHREWEENGEPRTYDSRYTYYNASQLEVMLQKAGFAIESLAGNYEGDKPSAETNRLIFLAQKVRKTS